MGWIGVKDLNDASKEKLETHILGSSKQRRYAIRCFIQPWCVRRDKPASQQDADMLGRRPGLVELKVQTPYRNLR